jgi:hypothetical protein
MDILNARELALLIWVCVAICLILIVKQIREPFLAIIKKTFAAKLVAVYVCMIAYTALIVYFLSQFKLWDKSQLKNTIVWVLTVGFVSLFEISPEKNINYLKKALKDIFKFTAIIEFIINVYTLNLFVELLIIPIAVFIVGISAFAKREERHKPVAKLMNGILSLFGLFLICYAIYRIINSFSAFASKGTLNDFVMPPALSLLFLPFVYLLSIFMGYENSFNPMERAIGNASLTKYAKRKAIIYFNFDKGSLRRWQTYLLRNKVETKQDIDQSIAVIKRLNKIEKNPPVIPFEAGWSPYKAKEFLSAQGLQTGHYDHDGDGEWFACSLYLDLKDSPVISNNISYYITGNEGVATTLKLQLNINDPNAAYTAHQKLLECATMLYNAASNKNIPDSMDVKVKSGNAVKLKDGNRTISVAKNEWPKHKLKGYSISFTIEVAAT